MAAGLELEINGTEPVQPATGFSRVFIDADGDLAYKRVDGTVGKVKGGGILNLAGYDLTLGADSTLAGSLTGGGEMQVAAGAVAQVLRSGVGMLRGSGEAANRVPFFGTNTDTLDGDAGMTYDKTVDRLTVAGGLVAPGMRPAADSTTAMQLMNAAGTPVLTVDTTNSKIDLAALKIGGVDVPYATGTWTPALNFGNATTGITYSAASGFYMHIGKLVLIQGVIILTSKGSATGNANITGFPITSLAGTYGLLTLAWQNMTSSYVNMVGFINAGTATASIRGITAAGTTNLTNVTDAGFANNAIIYLHGIYRAA